MPRPAARPCGAARHRHWRTTAVQPKGARPSVSDARPPIPLCVRAPSRRPRCRRRSGAPPPIAGTPVRGHRWAVHEVPGPQVPFLVLDDQHALAHEDQEVLLDRLGVVEGRRLPRRDNADREPGTRLHVLREIRTAPQHEVVGLEDADAAVVVVADPRGFGRVDDEPAWSDRCHSGCDTFKACFADHVSSCVVDLGQPASPHPVRPRA